MNKQICIFVSDLHGRKERFDKLFHYLQNEKPNFLFIGGDIFPNFRRESTNFDEFCSFLESGFSKLPQDLIKNTFYILGNDDPATYLSEFLKTTHRIGINYVHQQNFRNEQISVVGYSFIPPTPFSLKDWEKYDVSRYVDPGCFAPNEGRLSIERHPDELEWSTIAKDLDDIAEKYNVSESIFLFHTPPYRCNLDRAALDGKSFDHVPLDVHIGSIAVMNFIEKHQPPITLHGHVHESTRLTGTFKQQFGNTWSFNAAHDGKELCIVRFEIANPSEAERILI